MLTGLFGGTLLAVGVWCSYQTTGLLAAVFGAALWIVHRAERSMDREMAQIVKKLKKRDRQKSKYTKKLKRLTRQQGEIISAISHEFKNPVAAIIGYAQTVHDDPDLSPELREKFLEKVIRNSERISEMIDRLSLAITFENTTLEPRKEPFDLAVLLEEITDSLRQKYPNRTVSIRSTPSPVTADRMMFGQVLSNLIDNALKYSEAEVEVLLDRHLFRVTDRGIGIDPDAIGKITRRFYRADTRSWDNSIGVGLFLVEYILKLHGTQLHVTSTPGRGSTFGFDLPSEDL